MWRLLWDKMVEFSQAWSRPGLGYGCVCQGRAWEGFLMSWKMSRSCLQHWERIPVYTGTKRHEIMGHIRGIVRNVFQQCISSVHYYHFASYFHFISSAQLDCKLLQGRTMSNLSFVPLLQLTWLYKCNTELLFTGGIQQKLHDSQGLGNPAMGGR